MYKSNIQKEAKELPESDTEPVFISLGLVPSNMSYETKSYSGQFPQHPKLWHYKVARIC
jgi:hypothetical protein